MITVDAESGLAVDYARVYRGTDSEPDEDGESVVMEMTIGDEGELVLEYRSGPHHTLTQIFVPLDRLKPLVMEN